MQGVLGHRDGRCNDHSNVRWRMQAKTSRYILNSLHASLSSSFLFLNTSPFHYRKSLAVSIIGKLLGNLLSYTPAFDDSEMGFWTLKMVKVPNSVLILLNAPKCQPRKPGWKAIDCKIKEGIVMPELLRYIQKPWYPT